MVALALPFAPPSRSRRPPPKFPLSLAFPCICQAYIFLSFPRISSHFPHFSLRLSSYFFIFSSYFLCICFVFSSYFPALLSYFPVFSSSFFVIVIHLIYYRVCLLAFPCKFFVFSSYFLRILYVLCVLPRPYVTKLIYYRVCNGGACSAFCPALPQPPPAAEISYISRIALDLPSMSSYFPRISSYFPRIFFVFSYGISLSFHRISSYVA